MAITSKNWSLSYKSVKKAFSDFSHRFQHGNEPTRAERVRRNEEAPGSDLPAGGTQAPFDYVLLFSILGAVVFGLIMIYSASFIYAQERTGDGYYFIRRQLLHVLIGCAALFVACRLDYRSWERWAFPALLAATGLLVLATIPGIGSRAGGAQRWVALGGLRFQPSEFIKFTLILYISRQLARRVRGELQTKAGTYSLLWVPLPALGLLLAQPDFGTTFLVVSVLFLLLFLAGIAQRYLISALVLLGTVASLLVLRSPYRMARLSAFLDPWKDPEGKGFQILQSLVGMHHGSIWGVGLGNSKEKLFYLPEAHNDFIFAVIGEELGLIGVLAVALIFLFLVYRGLRVAWFNYRDTANPFGLLVAAGITLCFGLQGFANMAVALGLIPTKGIPLPLISYGGSAIIAQLFSFGVILSISRGVRQKTSEA